MMKRNLTFTLLLALALNHLGCGKGNGLPPGCEGGDPLAQSVTLGPDTTINYGDSVLLDPGPGYTSYLWNDGVSTQQTLKIPGMGTYWVRVSDCHGGWGSDTIAVSYRNHSDTIPCVGGRKSYTLPRFARLANYQISFPCCYVVSIVNEEDSWSFSARSADRAVSFGYSDGGPPIFEVTFDEPPLNFMGTDTMVTIHDGDREVGTLYYPIRAGGSGMHWGWFLFRDDDFYVQHSNIKFRWEYFQEVKCILATIKMQQP